MPKERSKINNKAAENKTGKDKIPIIAVKKKAQMVNGRRVKVIPFVRMLITVET